MPVDTSSSSNTTHSMGKTSTHKTKNNRRNSSSTKRNSVASILSSSEFNEDHLLDDYDHKKSSLRSFQSLSSGELGSIDTNNIMGKDSPSKSGSRRKMSMVVKKHSKNSTSSNKNNDLEGELTNFLSKQTRKIALPTKTLQQQDDGTTSTTSRTTSSNEGGRKNNSNSNSNSINGSGRSHETNITEATNNNSSRDTSIKEGDWDWSHHSNDWMNIQSSSQNRFEQSYGADFLDLDEDEHLHTLNDSIGDVCMSPGISPVPRKSRKPHSSRRVQRQQEIQNSLSQSFNRGESSQSSLRRFGELPFADSTMQMPRRSSGSKPRRCTSEPNRQYDYDEQHQQPVSTSSISDAGGTGAPMRRRSGTTSRRGSRTTGRSHSRDKSRDRRTRDKSRNQVRGASHDRSSRDKSRDNKSSNRSQSPSTPQQPRRGSRSRRRPSGSHHRSRSSDRTTSTSKEHEFAVPEAPPLSSSSRRGRRRNSMGNTASEQQQQEQLQQSHHGRRRSSMSHATISTTSTAHEKERSRHKPSQQHEQQRRRGSSLSARTARRRGSMDTSYHSVNSSSAAENRSLSRRRRSRSSTHTRRPRSRSIDKSSRSLRTDELLPERLSNLLDRGTGDDSHLEKLALAILVAEGDKDLDQAIYDAVDKIPTHLLDPSKVRLNMQW